MFASNRFTAKQSPSQFNNPSATITSTGLIFVVSFNNSRVQVFNRDGTGPIKTHHIPTNSKPVSVSEERPDRIVVCASDRTTFDFSSTLPQQPPIQRTLVGDWQGTSYCAVAQPDGSLIVLAGMGTTFTFERFIRGFDSEWVHHSSIQLPECLQISVSFTCDPVTRRVWWCWGSQTTWYIGCWDVATGQQLFEREIGLDIFQMASRLDQRGCILMCGRTDNTLHCFSQDGSLVDQVSSSQELLFTLNIALDGTIVTGTFRQVNAY